MRMIWGFDLGVTSVGFAILKWDESTNTAGMGEILRLGVRVSPESREKDLAPKNATRRHARLMRRQCRRRHWRRRHLRTLLTEFGLLPDDKAVPPPGQDPYALRARGLTAPLAPQELAWAIFHLLKRRGFQGSRKRAAGGNTKPPEDKNAEKTEEEAEKTRQALQTELNGRKLGAYLADIKTSVENPK